MNGILPTLCLVLLGFSHSLFAQMTVQGSVLDARGVPINEAEVFLNNTSYSTKTDDDGTYTLEVEPGIYELIVYKRGFKPVVHPLQVDQPLDVQIKLSELTVRLKQHQVNADRDPEWYRNLKVFEENFLGSSKNGRGCEILNPHVLILDKDPSSGHLKAWADEPLLIRNKHLGYDITYVLEEYYQQGQKYTYLGYVRYMDTPGLKLKKRHFQARKQAYYGSVMHMIRAIQGLNTQEEGFELRRLVEMEDGWEPEPAEFEELVNLEKGDVFLEGSGRYRIIYMNERPEFAYLHNRPGISAFQVSEIEFSVSRVKLLPSGGIEPPLGIEFKGYMGWERIGDALPMDYVIDED